MNARILELEKIAATIHRTVVSLAREPFDVNGHRVGLDFSDCGRLVEALVDGEYVGLVAREHPSRAETLAGMVAKACNDESVEVLGALVYRFTRAGV